MNSPQTKASELAAVADAIRGHERFVLTTHENPDGDALGSLLAMKLALDQLGKDGVMVLVGDAPLPGEDAFSTPTRRQRRCDSLPSSSKQAPTCTGCSRTSTSRCSSRS